VQLPKAKLRKVIHGGKLTINIAFRLSKYFGNSAQFWINLQENYDLQRRETNGM
jgi:addiction module HigA family antidote